MEITVCSMPIYRRLWVMPNNALRLPAQSLMNQAATSKLSAISHKKQFQVESLKLSVPCGALLLKKSEFRSRKKE